MYKFGLVFLLLTELCFITRSTGEECKYNGICYMLDRPDINSELAESQASVSFSCNYDNITVIHDWDSIFRLRTLIVSCNSADDNVNFTKVIDCELDITRSTVSLNTSLLGLSAGSQCNLFGCQIKTSRVEPYYTHRIINESCTIPRDCVMSEWSDWTDCSCEGHQSRARDILLPAFGHGNPCQNVSETRQCTKPSDCPVDCVWGQWSNWTNCSCDGRRNRTRDIVTAALNSGKPCQNGNVDFESCSKPPACPIDLSGPIISMTSGIVVAFLLLLLIIALAIFLTIRIFMTRRTRRLDHKRLEKLMGTFDPNFAPEFTTNLKKVNATSEHSVFNSLWLPGGSMTKDYITLDELGIHICNPAHKGYSSSEKSVELKFTDLSQRSQDSSQESLSHPGAEKNSGFSLDYRTVAKIFKLDHMYENSHFSDGDDQKDDPGDFIEDQLRIVINESDEEDSNYMAANEENNFIENSFKIDIDQSMNDLDTGYMNVGGVMFSYPSCGELETAPLSSSQQSASLTDLSDEKPSALVHSCSSPLF